MMTMSIVYIFMLPSYVEVRFNDNHFSLQFKDQENKKTRIPD